MTAAYGPQAATQADAARASMRTAAVNADRAATATDREHGRDDGGARASMPAAILLNRITTWCPGSGGMACKVTQIPVISFSDAGCFL